MKKDDVKKVKEYFDILARDSAMHKKVVEELIRDLKKEV